MKPMCATQKATTKLVSSSEPESEEGEDEGEGVDTGLPHQSTAGVLPHSSHTISVATPYKCQCVDELSKIPGVLKELLQKCSDTATRVDRVYVYLKQGRVVAKAVVSQGDAPVEGNQDPLNDSAVVEDDAKFISKKGVCLLGI